MYTSYITSYGLIFLGDYNAGVEGKNINIFCSNYKNCIKSMCYKNPDKPTCIDLIITKSPQSFQNSCIIDTRPSDFHKMFVTVMQTFHRKTLLKIIHYGNYKNFSNDVFRKLNQKIFSKNSVNSLGYWWLFAILQ